MNQLSDILRTARAKKKLSQEVVAKEIGITQRAYGFYEDGQRTPPLKKLKKIISILEIPELDIMKYYSTELEQNVPREQKEKIATKTPSISINNDTINNLSEGNRELCQANKTLADAHYIIAQGNTELIQMLKSAMTGVPFETREDAQARIAPVLELIARIGSGRTKWRTYEEGLAEVHKLVGA